MPRACLTCEHKSKEEIDKMLRSGELPRVVSERYPGLSEGAIRRHSQHTEGVLPSSGIIVRKGSETALINAVSSAGMLSELSSLYAEADAVSDFALNRGNENVSLKALTAKLSILETVRKLGEDTRSAGAATANAHASEDLTKLTLALKAVLPKFPDAGEALAKEMERMDEWEVAARIRDLSMKSRF